MNAEPRHSIKQETRTVQCTRICRCLNVEIQIQTAAPAHRRSSSQTKLPLDIPDVPIETWNHLTRYLHFEESVDATLFEACMIESISIKYRWLVSSKSLVNRCQLFRCWCCQSDLFLSDADIIGPAMVSLRLQPKEEIDCDLPSIRETGQYSDFFELILPAAASPQPESPMVGHPLSNLVEQIRLQEETDMQHRIDEFVKHERQAYAEKCFKLEEENEIVRHASIACYRNHFGYNHPLLEWSPPEEWQKPVEPFRLSQVDMFASRESTLRTDPGSITPKSTDEAPLPRQIEILESTAHTLRIQSSGKPSPSASSFNLVDRRPSALLDKIGQPISSPPSTSSRSSITTPSRQVPEPSFTDIPSENRLLPPSIYEEDYENEEVEVEVELEAGDDDEDAMFEMDEDVDEDDSPEIVPSSMNMWETQATLLFYGVPEYEPAHLLPPMEVIPDVQIETQSGRNRRGGVLTPRSRASKEFRKFKKFMQTFQGSSVPVRFGAAARLLSQERHTPKAREFLSPMAATSADTTEIIPPHTISESVPAAELAFSVPTRFKSMV